MANVLAMRQRVPAEVIVVDHMVSSDILNLAKARGMSDAVITMGAGSSPMSPSLKTSIIGINVMPGTIYSLYFSFFLITIQLLKLSCNHLLFFGGSAVMKAVGVPRCQVRA